MEGDLFAGVAVSDFDRAVDWFERLLGGPADFAAHDTELVWAVAEHAWIYVELLPERAGGAMATVFLEDLDGFVEAAAARGVHPASQETYGNGVRKVLYRDPDGNEIGVGGGPLEDDARVRSAEGS